MAPSLRIAVLIDTATSWGTDLVDGVIGFAQERPAWQLLCEPRVGERLQLPAGWSGSGVIAQLADAELAAHLVTRQIPAVNVALTGYGEGNIPRCTADPAAAAQLCWKHFTAHGLRAFAYCGPTRVPNFVDRFGAAFVDAVRASGQICAWYETPEQRLPWHEDRQAVAHWLQQQSRPVGLLCFDTIRGRQAAEACQLVGLRIPDDVAILCGEHDRLAAQLTSPRLASCDLAPKTIGYQAAALLEKVLLGEVPPGSTVGIPPRGILAAESTDRLPTEDPVLMLAIRWLRTHAHEPVDIGDLLRHIPLSRRMLEQRFQAALGHTPAEELRQLRLKLAQQLLRETTLPLTDIATRSGFASADVLTRVFRRGLGMTPGEYRQGG